MEIENGATTDDGFQDDVDADEVEFTPEESFDQAEDLGELDDEDEDNEEKF